MGGLSQVYVSRAIYLSIYLSIYPYLSARPQPASVPFLSPSNEFSRWGVRTTRLSAEPRSTEPGRSLRANEMDPIAIGLDAIAHERERYEQAPSAAGAATLAKLHAQVALSQLLEGAVQPAQATLTEVLNLGAQLPQSSHAAIKNDLAICAMHDGRPADALPLLERALQLLPDASSTLESSMLRSRVQLQLNLCEALLLRGSLEEAVQSATEAVRLSEMALPRHGEREIEGVRKTGGATPRLFTSKWLLPRRGPTQTQMNAPTGCAGALAAPEALLLGWLWRALAQEGLGLFQEALVRPCGASHQLRPSCNPNPILIPYSPSPSPRPHPHPHSPPLPAPALVHTRDGGGARRPPRCRGADGSA